MSDRTHRVPTRRTAREAPTVSGEATRRHGETVTGWTGELADT
jgi:hypothetical protein